MATVIDRRENGGNKSAVNKQRFIKRYREQIRQAVAKAVSGRKIMDIEQSGQVSIPVKDISEPVFHHGQGGKREWIHPGNKKFIRGDSFDRQQQGAGGTGSRASDSGEGEDDFVFTLSREDFLNFFFEDMALPDMAKRHLAKIAEVRKVRAGYSIDGTPSNLSVLRTMRSSLGRRIALSSPYQKRLRALEKEYEETVEEDGPSSIQALAMQQEIRMLRGRIDRVPFIERLDLRYNNRILKKRPQAQAVMFCLMDVSGSMDESRKDLAKRFFMLLYLFLKRNYERIDVVFIRHHTVAKEVDEEDFFHSRESGGTVVSSALKLMIEVIHSRYPASQWNIYCAQASDGDNWAGDSELCGRLLREAILPLVQYYAYVEVASEEPQNLWEEYMAVKGSHENFAMQRIIGADEIYPVLHDLFQKKAA
ncbi:YeaH/YhbH family protein [Cupriavidus sp. AU9028]|uniref:YeaH/YhbH family protein n=1 Tax=Cupriavidus sp. AU9028 TaxID=2871157 RepID=UPI001C967EA4|nr:YeaH/YhbH family protein [Cupriavidus sp. AU9028]MBY4896914.1 YeaH/YhbH family protein [Cupriavidus sp. AU9028]